jgi:uncharacterized protein YbaR (Trm112 family)
MRLDLALIQKLVCPATRTPLRFDAERQELVSDEAGLAYPVQNGTPILLIEEARKLGEDNDRG